MTTFESKLNRLRENGIAIAALTSESRDLRKEVAAEWQAHHGMEPNETEPLLLLMGNCVVSITKAKDCKDWNILFNDAKKIEELPHA